MRALLDTHAFLWGMMADERLSTRAKEWMTDGRNTLFLSAASAWEIVIKYQLGKLKLPEDPERYVLDRMSRHGMEALSIQLTHALHVQTLPDHHQDPFDRILIAQAQVEKLPILTSDPLIARYGVEIIW